MMTTKFRRILVIGAAFLAGGVAGYASYRSEESRDSLTGRENPPGEAANRAGNGLEESEPATRRTGPRQEKPVLTAESAGMVRLPAEMVDRIAIALLTSHGLNRETLAMLGLKEGQIDALDRVVTETLRRCREREKAVARDFTDNADELVLKIPGDRAWAAEVRKTVHEQIREIAGERALLVDSHLAGELESETMRFGISDYYLRLSRQPDQGQIKMLFESLEIRSGPEPGDSFVDFQKKWQYASSRRHGLDTALPEHVAALMEGRDWQRFLKPKP